MQKPLLVIVFLAVVGVGVYLYGQNASSTMMSDKNSMNQTEVMDSKDAMMTDTSENAMMKAENGEAMMEKKEDAQMAMTDSEKMSKRYLPYSSKAFTESANKRRVLFFFANWCPTCKPVDADFSAHESDIPEDVIVIRVNYNDSDTDEEEKALARQYGVTYQHTFVQIDETGNEVTKWNGGMLAELIEKVK